MVRNDVVNGGDYLGLDFIAVSARVAGGGWGAKHYSIELWESCIPAGEGKNWTDEKWLKEAKKHTSKTPKHIDGYELLVDEINWEAAYGKEGAWKDVPVSYIHNSSNGNEFKVIYEPYEFESGGANASKVAAKWKRVSELAKEYDYAEPLGYDPENPPAELSKWPNSAYGVEIKTMIVVTLPGGVLVDTVPIKRHGIGNNMSTTFVRWITHNAGLNWDGSGFERKRVGNVFPSPHGINPSVRKRQ
jgi:hypothetical protein